MTNEETKKQNQDNCYGCAYLCWTPGDRPFCSKLAKQLFCLSGCVCEYKHYSAQDLSMDSLDLVVAASRKHAEEVQR
jgi:hypothetical protein